MPHVIIFSTSKSGLAYLKAFRVQCAFVAHLYFKANPPQISIEQATQLREKDSTTAFAFFQNGVEYDIVRASIPALSDEELQEIYQKVRKA